MQERHVRNELRRRANALAALADRLDGQADAASAYARDCARWGFCDGAREARSRSRELRVGALMGRAGAAALTGAFVGLDSTSE